MGGGGGNDVDDVGDGLCLGSSSSSTAANISLVACNSTAVFLFNEATGRIVGDDTSNGHTSSHASSSTGSLTSSSSCATLVQRARQQLAPPSMIASACNPLPDVSQQFQFNPRTGALRGGGSQCIAEFDDDHGNYRDCCVALCLPAV